jgi:hypothetical protein
MIPGRGTDPSTAMRLSFLGSGGAGWLSGSEDPGVTGGIEEGAVLDAPVVDQLEGSSGEVVALFGADLVGADEVGFTQCTEMLRDGGLRHSKARGELFDGLIGGGEEGEDVAARGVGDSLEEGVGSGGGGCGHKEMLMASLHKRLLMASLGNGDADSLREGQKQAEFSRESRSYDPP